MHLGALYVDRPDLGDAAAHLALAQEWHDAYGDLRGRGRVRILLGRLAVRDGQPDKAVAHLAEAVDLLRPVPRMCAAALVDLGEAWIRIGDPDRAGAALAGARDMFARIGATSGLARVEARLAELHGA